MNTLIECINKICLIIDREDDTKISFKEMKVLLYHISMEASKATTMSFEELKGKYLRIDDSVIKPILMDKFPELGYYQIVLNLSSHLLNPNNAFGDSIDDLCDIIKDLSEVKWRIENIDINDGLDYMRFVFEIHTEDHIVGLLAHINDIE